MKLTKEERNKVLLDMNSSGKSVKDIASFFDVSETCVRGWLKSIGQTFNKVHREFTDAEKQFMLSLHEKPTDAVTISKVIGTTQARVLKFLKDAGKNTSYFRFSDKQISSILTDYNSGFTFEMLEQKYDVYRQSLAYILKKNNVTTRNRRERKQNSWYVWEDAFKDMSDERSLFFYGLLLSDGCIYKSNRLSICLQARDKLVLDDLNKYLRRDSDLLFTKRREPHHQDKYTLSLQDPVIVNTLFELGMTNNKSLKESPPKCHMPDDNARHFWRGCVAGDGSVKNYNGLPHIYLCGSEELCSEFSKFIGRILLLKTNPKVNRSRKHRSGPWVYNTRINGSGAVELGDYLFKDSTVNIQRKLDEYLKFKDYAPKFTRKTNKLNK